MQSYLYHWEQNFLKTGRLKVYHWDAQTVNTNCPVMVSYHGLSVQHSKEITGEVWKVAKIQQTDGPVMKTLPFFYPQWDLV